MENLLKYYYKLCDCEIINFENDYLIFDNNDYVYLLKLISKSFNVDYILNVIKQIKYPNNYGNIILNIDNKYISKYGDKEYILIHLKNIINEKVLLKDMVINNINNRSNYKIDNDIVNLWSKKVDYIEYQVSELAKDRYLILNSFYFFAGLAENAISFIEINNINFNNLHMTVSHSRIKEEELNIDYYNPLNILLDYDIRDYAEYIKSKILFNEDILKDLNYILDNAQLNNDDIKLLYARLMFPTLYFDKVEEILLDNKNENELNIYIDSVTNYINTLSDIYVEIQKKGISLDIPKWIIKEH